jgi:hypothetical protein
VAVSDKNFKKISHIDVSVSYCISIESRIETSYLVILKSLQITEQVKTKVIFCQKKRLYIYLNNIIPLIKVLTNIKFIGTLKIYIYIKFYKNIKLFNSMLLS